MEGPLYSLIRDYQRTTRSLTAAFLERAGIAHPFEWRSANLARAGFLPGTPPIQYEFHGAGLRLVIDRDHVDFDFGFDGRTTGFNEWWLARYAEDRPSRYPEFVAAPHRIGTAMAAAAATGEIVQPFKHRQDDLWYLRGEIEDPSPAT